MRNQNQRQPRNPPRTKKRKKIIIKGVKPNRILKARYKKLLGDYAKKMNLIIKNFLFGLLNKRQNDLTLNFDGYQDVFYDMGKQLDDLYKEITPHVLSLLFQMREADKKKFYSQADSALGIDIGQILEKENIRDSFALAIEQNLSLIKRLNEQQLSRVKNVVLSDLRFGSFSAKSIQEMIIKDFGISTRHAYEIARDQSNKLTSTLTELRYKNMRVKRYIWRTMQDQRVRGNPTGKYPHSEPSHYEREGEIFEFDNPPEGGNPGMPINCRCYAEGVYEDD